MRPYSLSASYTDFYQITMGQAYFLEGNRDTEVCFDYFFRKVPNDGGYVLFAGLFDLLETLEAFRFSDEDIAFLQVLNLNPAYIDYLKGFQFNGSIWSVREGDVVFPTRPILRVEGNFIEAQLVETVILNILNFQSLVATKASRMRQAAGKRILSDFGLRRAHGLGGIHASRAAIIGGFDSTSNVLSARLYDCRADGTMAHSYIEGHDDELAAFRSFAQARPDNCVLLVDTYDTLASGLPNAITVAREMLSRGKRLLGIRLDSGDLAWLAKRSREMLDAAGLADVKIVASNQLDEFVISSLLEQGAPIDVFGVGTRLVTGQPDAALDGVYKLSLAGGIPRLKLSENIHKVTLPGRKQVYRAYDRNGYFLGADAVVLDDEAEVGTIHHPFDAGKSMDLGGCRTEALLEKVYENGEIQIERRPIAEIREYGQHTLQKLPAEYRRFQNPHIYKVGISTKLMELRNELKDKFK